MPAPRTDRTLLIDASASMLPHRDAVIREVTALLREAADEPDTTVTLLRFNESVTPLADAVPAAPMPRFCRAVYAPTGRSALDDAVVHALDHTNARLHATPPTERPARVELILLTDGNENASTTHTRHGTRARIQHWLNHTSPQRSEEAGLPTPTRRLRVITPTPAGAPAAASLGLPPHHIHCLTGGPRPHPDTLQPAAHRHYRQGAPIAVFFDA